MAPPPIRLGSKRDKGKQREEVVVGLGDASIDGLLGGGLRGNGMITELVGERFVPLRVLPPDFPALMLPLFIDNSSSGKTQLALSYTLSAVLASTTSHAIYLSAEGHLPTTRLLSLVPPDQDVSALDRVHFLAANDFEALEHTLSYLVPAHVSRLTARGHSVDLIVLDSLAALLRPSFDNTPKGLSERSQAICSIADKFKSIGVQHGPAVLVVNQVSDVFGDLWPSSTVPSSSNSGSSTPAASQRPPPSQPPFPIPKDVPEPWMSYKDQSKHFNGSTPSLRKEASLGLVWANSISTRIMLSSPPNRFRKVGVTFGAEKDEGASFRVRRMDLVFSPLGGRGTVEYVVLGRGVVSVPTLKGVEGPAEGVKRKRSAGDDGRDQSGDEYGKDDASWVLDVDEEFHLTQQQQRKSEG